MPGNTIRRTCIGDDTYETLEDRELEVFIEVARTELTEKGPDANIVLRADNLVSLCSEISGWRLADRVLNEGDRAPE